MDAIWCCVLLCRAFKQHYRRRQGRGAGREAIRNYEWWSPDESLRVVTNARFMTRRSCLCQREWRMLAPLVCVWSARCMAARLWCCACNTIRSHRLSLYLLNRFKLESLSWLWKENWDEFRMRHRLKVNKRHPLIKAYILPCGDKQKKQKMGRAQEPDFSWRKRTK